MTWVARGSGIEMKAKGLQRCQILARKENIDQDLLHMPSHDRTGLADDPASQVQEYSVVYVKIVCYLYYSCCMLHLRAQPLARQILKREMGSQNMTMITYSGTRLT